MKFPSQLHAALAARKSAFALAADFFLVPLAMPCETAFSTAPSVTPFFTAFRTAFSIFLTALVCSLAIVQPLRREDDLRLGIVHGASLSSPASRDFGICSLDLQALSGNLRRLIEFLEPTTGTCN